MPGNIKHDPSGHAVGAEADGAEGAVNGSGVSGSASAAQTDSTYKSVTQTSGIAAGDGGFDLHVGNHTDLIGGVIASTADASKNLLDTGSLSYTDLQNKADYSAWSASVGGGYGTGNASNMTGFTGGGSIPQGKSENSVTQAGIAQGTIRVRNNPGQDLSGLDRTPDIDAQGLKTIFDAQKVAEKQELGQIAGYVGMRSVGTLSAYMVTHATTEKEQAAWSDGGRNKVILHGLVGAGTAALGGGNALQGALGATASEAASGAMQDYLWDKGINPDSPRGKTLMNLASLGLGAAAGGGAGAAMALNGEQYNRQLHPNEIAWLKSHGKAYAHAKCGCDPSDAQVEAATRELTRQALRQVDARWAGILGGGNDAQAQQWLAAHRPAEATVGDSNDAYFTATEAERNDPMGYFYALDHNDANKAFVQWAAGVGTPGSMAKLKGTGVGAGHGVRSLVDGIVDVARLAKSELSLDRTLAELGQAGKLITDPSGFGESVKENAAKAPDHLAGLFQAAGQGYANQKLDALYGGYSGDAAVLTFGAFQLLNPEEKIAAVAELAKAGDAAKLAKLETDAGKAGRLDAFKRIEAAAQDAADDGIGLGANGYRSAFYDTDGKAIQWRNPLTNEVEAIPAGAKVHNDHILPKQKIKGLKGYNKLTKEQKKAILNDPVNLQPMEAYRNCSKGCKLMDSGDPWIEIKIRNEKIDPDYKEWLKDQQQKMQDRLEKRIQNIQN